MNDKKTETVFAHCQYCGDHQPTVVGWSTGALCVRCLEEDLVPETECAKAGCRECLSGMFPAERRQLLTLVRGGKV